MGVVLKIVTGNQYDVRHYLRWLSDHNVKFNRWRDCYGHEGEMSGGHYPEQLYQLLNQMDRNMRCAKGEYWEAFNHPHGWIGIQASPYYGNKIITAVMSKKLYKSIQGALWQRLDTDTANSRFKAAYICDEADLWSETKKQLEAEEIRNENCGCSQNMAREQIMREAYGNENYLDDIYYPACWAMWLYEAWILKLPQIAEFGCYRNEARGKGRFIQLYKRMTAYALPQSRNLQWAFGVTTGIDNAAEEMRAWIKENVQRQHKKGMNKSELA